MKELNIETNERIKYRIKLKTQNQMKELNKKFNI